jgi:hypothetical protein
MTERRNPGIDCADSVVAKAPEREPLSAVLEAFPGHHEAVFGR